MYARMNIVVQKFKSFKLLGCVIWCHYFRTQQLRVRLGFIQEMSDLWNANGAQIDSLVHCLVDCLQRVAATQFLLFNDNMNKLVMFLF